MKKILVVVLALSATALALLWFQEDKGQANDLSSIRAETYNFCGREYKSAPVILFEIDMTQRIAELATEMPETGICENISNNASGSVITTELRYRPDDASGIYHYLGIGPIWFSLDPEEEKIYVHAAFDGAPTLLGGFK